MKLAENDLKIERSQSFQETSFTIKEEGLSHIFSILRDQLYSNKPLAVVREYMCNAYDTHVAAKKEDVPFSVKLPSVIDPYFRVRDYGTGLNYDGIVNIFASYGESTKRDSNDYIGAFGIGSKAAFAYTDSYSVVGYIDGKKTVYHCYIDETKRGKVAVISSEATDEENGLEIVVPIKPADFPLFINNVGELYKYFKVKPKVTGAAFNTSPRTYVYESSLCRIAQDYQPSVIVMGNVGYKIDPTIFAHLPYFQKQALSTGLELPFGIGSLEIAASREALQYTEKTKAAISQRIKDVFAEIKAERDKEVHNISTYKEALEFWKKYCSGWTANITGEKQVVWKGFTIKGPHFYLYDTPFKDKLTLKFCHSSTSINKRVTTGTPYLHNLLDVDSKLFIDDVDNDELLRLKGKQHYLEGKGNCHFIKGLDKDIEEFSKILGFDCKPASAMPLPPKSKAIKKIANKVTVYEFDTAASLYRNNSGYWKEVSIDLATEAGYFIEIDRFRPYYQSFYIKATDFAEKLLKLKALGFDLKGKNIYGVKGVEIKGNKVGPNLVSIEETFKKWCIEYINTPEIRLACTLNDVEHRKARAEFVDVGKIPFDLILYDGPYSKWIEASKQVEINIKPFDKYATIVTLNVLPTADTPYKKVDYVPMLSDLYSNMLKVYPLLNYFAGNPYQHNLNLADKNKAFTDYINQQDKLNGCKLK